MKIESFTLPGLSVTCVPMEKFKTIGVSLRMIGDFEESNVNRRAIMPQILLGASKKYSNKQQLNRRLDYLYSTEFQASTQKIGNQSVVSFDMLIVNPKYLSELTNLLQEGLSLMAEIVLRPKLRNQSFMLRLVEEEKRLLKEELEATYHDKTEYGFFLFKNKMFDGELFHLNPKGELNSIGLEDRFTLTESYTDMISNDQKELYIIGDINPAEVIDACEKVFSFSPVVKTLSWIDLESSNRNTPQSITEYGDLTQSRITIGYRTPIRSNDPLATSMGLFNIMFGESDQSVLFQTVREKHHMSYYVSSNYVGNKGVLIIFAGVVQGDEQKAIDLIESSLYEFNQGVINEDALSLAKETLINRIIRSSDSLSAIIGRHFMNMKLFESPFDIDAKIKEIQDVTIDDILAASSTLTLDTIHIYQSEEATNA